MDVEIRKNINLSKEKKKTFVLENIVIYAMGLARALDDAPPPFRTQPHAILHPTRAHFL